MSETVGVDVAGLQDAPQPAGSTLSIPQGQVLFVQQDSVDYIAFGGSLQIGAPTISSWIQLCEAAGFDAVEIDNLDTFARSGGRLTEADAVAMMRLFADGAHARGMAVAQKNSAELVDRRAEMATDFVVAEECNRYDECDVYTAVYGTSVLVIEYREQDFTEGCAAFPQLSIVLRDRDLVGPSDAAYSYDGC